MLAGWLAAAGGTALAFTIAGSAAVVVAFAAFALLRTSLDPARGAAAGTVHA